MNVEKMKALAIAARAIEAKGLEAKIDSIESIEMGTFGRPTHCGYAACLAGTAVALLRPDAWVSFTEAREAGLHANPYFLVDGEVTDIYGVARKELELNSAYASRLFIENAGLDAGEAIDELVALTEVYEAKGDEGALQWLNNEPNPDEDDWDD